MVVVSLHFPPAIYPIAAPDACAHFLSRAFDSRDGGVRIAPETATEYLRAATRPRDDTRREVQAAEYL